MRTVKPVHPMLEILTFSNLQNAAQMFIDFPPTVFDPRSLFPGLARCSIAPTTAFDLELMIACHGLSK